MAAAIFSSYSVFDDNKSFLFHSIVLNVKVHDVTIRKRLNRYGLFGRVVRESLFSPKKKKNMPAQLRFAKFKFEQLTRLMEHCNLEMFGHNISTNISHLDQKGLIPAGSGWVMIWVCSAATGLGHLVVTQSN